MKAAATSREAPVPEAPARDAGYLASTIRHGAIYGLGMVLAKAIGFVMLPIYTRVLTPADYGVLELLSLTTDVIAMVAGVGLSWAVTRYFYYYEDDPPKQAAVVSSAAILLVVFFGLATMITLPFARPLAGLVTGEPGHAGLVRLAIAGFFLSSLLEVPLAFLRARQASVQVVLVSLARLLLALGLNILLVLVLRRGVAGVLWSMILTSAAVGGWLLVTTLRETGLRFSRPIARQLLVYGAPLVAANVGSTIIHYSDRYVLRAYGSLESVGLYSLAYKFAILLSVFIATPFSQIWAPKALEIHAAEGAGAPPILRRIITHYNLVLVACALGLALFAGDVIRVMASAEYHGAAGLVPLLCLGMLFFGYRQVSYLGAAIRERSDIIAGGTVLGAAVVLAANFALIPRWGAMGAALATLLAFGSEFTFVMARAERLYPLRYPVALLLAPVGLAVVLFWGTEMALAGTAALEVIVPVKLSALAAFAAVSILIARARGGSWALVPDGATLRTRPVVEE